MWKCGAPSPLYSTTKGMAAAAMALAHSRGLFHLDDWIADHWPAFGRQRKSEITVRQMLSHRAGLAALDEKLSPEWIANRESLSALLANSTARTLNRFTRRTLLRTVGASGLASGLFSQSISATQTPATQEEFPPEKQTEWGEKAELGNGEIRTFVTLTKKDRPRFVGVWFPAETLNGLPSEHTENLLDIPEMDKTPFTFHQVNWNPHGHPPAGIYSVPHFDFHFHLTPESLLEEISAGSCERDGMSAHVTCEAYERGTEPLPPEQMPPGYVDSADVIPGMGNHLINPNALEFQNVRFRHTFIYGAFDGQLTFFEPMITRRFLKQRNEEVRTSIRMPDTMPRPGWYPTKYAIRYFCGDNSYAITLERFKQFES